MSRPKNETTTVKVTVLLTATHIAALDTAGVNARAASGAFVDRSAIIGAVIESADLPAVALEIARKRASTR